MKPENSTDINLSDSIHSNIEVHIIFNQEGVPYCQFVPSWKLMPTSAFFLGDPRQPSDYLMSDSGYPESYPMFSPEKLD